MYSTVAKAHKPITKSGDFVSTDCIYPAIKRLAAAFSAFAALRASALDIANYLANITEMVMGIIRLK